MKNKIAGAWYGLIRRVTPHGYIEHALNKDLERVEKRYSDDGVKAMQEKRDRAVAAKKNAVAWNSAALETHQAMEAVRFHERHFTVAARQSVKAVDNAIAAARKHGFDSPEALNLIARISQSCGKSSNQALPLEPGQTYVAPSVSSLRQPEPSAPPSDQSLLHLPPLQSAIGG